MAISYSNFLTQVRSYTEVDANVLTDTLLDQFLSNTELDIAGKVDYDDLRKYATATCVIGQRYLSLPSDQLVLRSVQVIQANGDRTFLESRDTSFISEYNNNGATGLPKYYANWNEQNFLVAPTPDLAYTVQINYITYPPHFTATNNTYLPQYQQQMLLYGVLVEAFSYLKGPQDMYNLYKSKYDEEVQAFAVQQMGRRRRSEYDNGVPRIKIESPSP
jgi:hypothetical protein|tara:strand:+ start:440 stop:1093 length:654 start_codon:yes stop_codon:yes gene_type:complete